MRIMNAEVSLSNPSAGYFDVVTIENIEDKNCFSYADNEGFLCEMCVYEDGLILFRQGKDHLLELHLKEEKYAKITSAEGSCKLDVKVVDFMIDSDILVLHYLIDDEERIIKIKYY
jgi:hypothetical protein